MQVSTCQFLGITAGKGSGAEVGQGGAAPDGAPVEARPELATSAGAAFRVRLAREDVAIVGPTPAFARDALRVFEVDAGLAFLAVGSLVALEARAVRSVRVTRAAHL